MELKETDRWFTPQDPILDRLALLWPDTGIQTDPCYDPDPSCVVQAQLKYDARSGQNGLVLPWVGRTYICPPYSQVAPWLMRSLAHSMAGGEVVALLNATPGSASWRDFVYDHAVVLFLWKRVKFTKAGSTKAAPNPSDSAVVYWGADKDRFIEIWGDLGKIIDPRQGRLANVA